MRKKPLIVLTLSLIITLSAWSVLYARDSDPWVAVWIMAPGITIAAALRYGSPKTEAAPSKAETEALERVPSRLDRILACPGLSI